MTLVLVLLVGLVVGSFLNVCIHRLPRGESVVRPRSRCPACGHRISWVENIPLLSWIALRGRCRHCGAPIALRYPAVELASGLILAWLWHRFGPGWSFWVASWLALASLALFFTDLEQRLLPDRITLPSFAVGLALAWVNPFLGVEAGVRRLWLALAGAALGAGILWGIGALWLRVRGVEAMGLGDVKMMAMLGAFTGPRGVLFTLFAASVSGALVGMLLVAWRRGSMRDSLPFGCFLAPAGLAALFWAPAAFELYRSLLLGGG